MANKFKVHFKKGTPRLGGKVEATIVIANNRKEAINKALLLPRFRGYNFKQLKVESVVNT